MNKITLILIVGFALAFAAGGSVGMLAIPSVAQDPIDTAEPTGSTDPGPDRRPGPEMDLRDLRLSPPQRDRMRQIWSEVMQDDFECRRQRDELWQARDEAVLALLNDRQRTQYDEILAGYERGLDRIEQEKHLRVQQAVQRTREVLNDRQAKEYDRIRHHRMPGQGPKGGRPGGFVFCGAYSARSTDGGRTWSEPGPLLAWPMRAINIWDNPLELHDGTVLAVFHVFSEQPKQIVLLASFRIAYAS